MIVICKKTGLTYAAQVYHANDFIELTDNLKEVFDGTESEEQFEEKMKREGLFAKGFRLPSLSEIIEGLKLEKVDLVQLSKSQREQVKDYMDRRTEELERLISDIKK